MASVEADELPIAGLPPTLAKLVIVSSPPVRFPCAPLVMATSRGRVGQQTSDV